MSERRECLFQLLILVAGLAVVVWLVICGGGCATLGDVSELRTAVASVENQVGDIRVGGEGDNFTTWLLVGGVVVVPVLGALYPLGVRRERKRKEAEERKTGRG